MRSMFDRLPDVRPVLAAAALAMVFDLLGLTRRDALLVGLAVLVLGYLGILASHGMRYQWPAADLEATDGTRREMTRLTWTLIGRDGRVTEAAVRRLREDATRRLAGHGVTLTDPGAVELLGPKVHAVLIAHGGLMPSLRELATCLDAVEALGPARPAPRPVDPDPGPEPDPAPAPSPATGPAPGVPVPRTAPATERPQP